MAMVAFGARQWSEHFGVEVEDVPLPEGFEDILAQRSKFMLIDEETEQEVWTNHLLQLIPNQIKWEGEMCPFTLDKLGQIVQERFFPQNSNNELGDHSNGFRFYHPGLSKSIREEVLDTEPYWVLMTKNVLQGTPKATWEAQSRLVQDEKLAEFDYRPPHILEAATSILGHYARTKRRLYSSEDECHYSNCLETFPNGWHVRVGDFGADGLRLGYSINSVGLGCCRKLPIPANKTQE